MSTPQTKAEAFRSLRVLQSEMCAIIDAMKADEKLPPSQERNERSRAAWHEVQAHRQRLLDCRAIDEEDARMSAIGCMDTLNRTSDRLREMIG